MRQPVEGKAARAAFVTACHRFLLNVVPFREPMSYHVLRQFMADTERVDLLPIEVDAVLLRCLVVLTRHATGSVPSLVERYLSNALSSEDGVTRFSRCVQDALRHHCIRDRSVQEAIHLIDARYAEPGCTPAFVADTLRLRLSTLDVAFRRETGQSPTKYIRSVRLKRSALLLATTSLSIKEVWSRVGYNHHSNYDHDFKGYFGMTPREYRARAIGPVARQMYTARQDSVLNHARPPTTRPERLLIVAGDEGIRTTVMQYLQLVGYAVACAATGADGLRQALQDPPDVVLLDDDLDDTDGAQVLRALRARFSGTHPSVALFTVDWDIVQRTAEVSSLNATVVSKLCDLEGIGEIVVQLCGEAGRRSSAAVERLTVSC